MALRQSDLLLGLRDAYLRIITAHDVPYAENIARLNDWLVYLYYCRMIGHLVPERDATIIDWGGGNGQVTQILRAMGYTAVKNYLVYVPERYDLFQRRFDIPTLYGDDPLRLALDGGSVDVLISSGVLEHVREDGVGREDVILRDIGRVLKPGGFLFIWNLPTMLSSSELLGMLTSRWRKVFTHKYRYSSGTISRLLGDAGFEVVYLDKHTLLPGAAMRALENKAGPLTLMRVDDTLSRIPPFSIFARNFGIVARKPAVPQAVRQSRD